MKPELRVLLIHNFYRQMGGEDYFVEQQKALMERAGWQVELFSVSSSDLNADPLSSSLSRKLQIAYSFVEKNRLRRLLDTRKFDVAHLHNLSPFISASVIDALPGQLPRVRTLHNYRYLCINGLLLRQGRPCDDCADGGYLPGIVHRCHEGSLLTSLAYSANRAMTMDRAEKVDLFLCPSHYLMEKHRQHAFQGPRLRQVSYAVPEPARQSELTGPGLFMGRLSEEKGCRVLSDALRADPGLRCEIAGSGPLEEELRRDLFDRPGMRMLGWLAQPDLEAAMARAAYVVLPAIWHDNQPLALLQALAMGLPLLLTRMGGLPELVEDGVNGYIVDAGDVQGLAAAMRRMQELPLTQRLLMGRASRRLYEERYSTEQHLASLEAVYREAVQLRNPR